MKQYEMMELEFKGDAPKGSDVEINLSAVFKNGANSIYVKGFYAGNETYKVRFLPKKPGLYSYEVNGVINKKGTFEVEKADRNSHGPVRAEGTHLKFADGSYFYSFGTTVYALAHQNDEVTEKTFDTLVKAPFNKVRMCLFPKHYNYNINDPKYFPFETFPEKEYTGSETRRDTETGEFLKGKDLSDIWDVNHPCFKFWDEFEKKIERLNNLGIEVDLILFHPYDRWGFSKLSRIDNLTYLDYLLRRFSAFPNIWWSMANEYDLCFSKTADDWKTFENFISKNDVYHHMLSNHNCFKMYDFSSKVITHCSIQKNSMNLCLELREKYHKPVLFDECRYEGNLKESWGAISGKEMVDRFWKATTTGAFCTHGEVFLNPDEKDVDNAVLWWSKGGKLHGESPKRIAFLRNIIEKIGAPLDPIEKGGLQLSKIKEDCDLRFPAETTFYFDKLNLPYDVEMARVRDLQYEYIGATEDKSAILYYYGADCHARVDIELPKDKIYRVEVIDAWNMTRETVASSVTGKKEIKLPGREYIAVLATEE